MFSTQDLEKLRGENSLESLCAIIQKNCPVILWSCEGSLYSSKTVEEFLDSIEKVDIIDDETFPGIWEFHILFKHGEGPTIIPSRWDEVSIFDKVLVDELKKRCFCV